jgi:hypothetical protein
MIRNGNKGGEKEMTGMETIIIAGGSVAFSAVWLSIMNPTKTM